MSVIRFRRRPGEIEAVRWTGDQESLAALERFAPVQLDPTTGALLLRAGMDGAQELVPVPVGHWIARSAGDPSDYWPIDSGYLADKYEPTNAR